MNPFSHTDLFGHNIALFQKVLELIIHLLELHKDVEKETRTNDPRVCSACFRVISKYLEGKSRKNKNYVTEMVEYLFSESVSFNSLYDLHAYDMSCSYEAYTYCISCLPHNIH